MAPIKLFRTATVPLSLNVLLKGQLAFLNRHFQVSAVSSSGTDLQEVHQREGVAVFDIDIARQISPLKDLLSLIRLYLLFRRERPHIVHSITPKAGLLSMLAAKMAGVPIRIHTFTGLVFPSRTGAMQKLLIAMDRLLCWAATEVYPEGEGVKKDLIQYKITHKPLTVIANGNVNGIDTEFFSPCSLAESIVQQQRQSLGLKNTDFVFIFVGRLVRDKGIHELIEAFKQLSAHHTHYKLLLVGPLEQELDPLSSETLTEIEQNPNIIAVGFQKDVRPYFALAQCLVFPSYREGFPNVVIQAGAMGLPAIVSDINGCNEIIHTGKNGLIIPAKDTQALYHAMFTLGSHPEQYQILQHNSRAMIISRYQQQYVWQSLLTEYQTLLRKRHVQELS